MDYIQRSDQASLNKAIDFDIIYFVFIFLKLKGRNKPKNLDGIGKVNLLGVNKSVLMLMHWHT